MHLRHRHGHAAADSRDHQHSLQYRDRNADGFYPRRADASRNRCHHGRRGSPPQHQQQRNHHQDADHADPGISRPPTLRGQKGLHRDGPDGAGEIVAARRRGDRDAAPLAEPVRDIGEQRPEGGGRTGADEDALNQREDGDRGREGCEQETGAQRDRSEQRRPHEADAVDGAADEDVAEGEADHGQRVGQRCVGAVDAELGLHRRQHDHDRPHAGTADGRDEHRDAEPRPGIGAVYVSFGRVRHVHG